MYAPSPEDTALRPLPRPPVRRPADARRGVRRLISRYFFSSAAVLCAMAALLFFTLPQQPAPGTRVGAGSAFAVLTLLALLALRARGAWVERAMFAMLAGTIAVIAGIAVAMGWGLGAPGLGFFGLFVCVVCGAGSRRMGLGLAAVSVAAVLAVAAATHATPARGPAELHRLLALLLEIGVGLAGGLLTTYVVTRYVRSADDREQRFRGLLAIAADAYWEIDDEYRLIAAIHQKDDNASLSLSDGLGRLPWELPQFGCDAETLDALIADLDTRLPFRNRLVHWETPERDVHALVISGEPRFSERGIFLGYWGVARDVTAELAARHALEATETRYQELFARIPTPLVLHRNGQVLDANPAALRLLGYTDLQALLGRDLLAEYESGDSRERERRRIEELAVQGAGSALPVADFRLVAAHGRRIAVRSAAVQVEAHGGLATLSIYVDDSERRHAEEAVRRSEAMLSHLVATSPDVITLTDLGTGRYAMVNRAFERITGYTAADVIGHTSTELGVWPNAEDRQRFVELVRERGIVTEMPTEFAGRNGRRLSMLASGARFVMDRREYLVINARDISEAERSRMEREAILENASVGIAVTRDRRFVLANPRFEQMYGWPPGALTGQPGRVVWSSSEAYAELAQSVAPALARGEPVEIERAQLRRDGSSFTARLRAKAIDPVNPTEGGTIWIVDDVTEQRAFERDLAAARDAAEAASRAKSAFLANTSHELRTPLNGLLHLAQLAREPGLETARRDQYLDQMVESARALATIINDILDLSKIEAGKLELETTTFDLGELLSSLQHSQAAVAAQRGLSLHLDLGADVAGRVRGDPLRVRQIIANYVGNALKFTESGGITLAALRHGRHVRFSVEDTGPGIEPAALERLFRPFTQGDESTTRRYGGTGLGLSICRELAHLMGGEVGVTSELGRGSTFWAELPLPVALEAETTPAPGADAPPLDLAGVRVLMVEDNPVNMMIAVAIIERWGVQVAQAFDGRQAIAAVQAAYDEGHPFHAVLMDVQMPIMSGHEATHVLRSLPAGQGLPIIALTAAALVNEREAAFAAGMDDFLTKPIDAERLREALGRWTRRRHVPD